MCQSLEKGSMKDNTNISALFTALYNVATDMTILVFKYVRINVFVTCGKRIAWNCQY
jgi:hypothetical protein